MKEGPPEDSMPAEERQGSSLAPIPLYEGPVRVRLESGIAEAHSKVTFEWLPSPHIQVELSSADTSRLHSFGELSVPEEALLFPEVEDWPTREEPALGPPEDEVRWSSLHLSIINFVNWDLPLYEEVPGQASRSVLAIDVEGWHIEIRSRYRRRGMSQRIIEMGGYAITHDVEIRRSDESTFAVQETELLQECLFLGLSFIKGAHVGLALPVGYDADEKRVWWQWSVTIVDSWRTPLSWCDPTTISGLGQILSGWMQLAADDFWRVVLMRAARSLVTANKPDPLDAAIPIGAIALEMLSWAILVKREDWIRPEDKLSEASMTRLMLRWAGIPAAIPPELVHLPSFISGVAQSDIDIAHGIWQTRNRLVHPPERRSQEWPNRNVMLDAWRIELEILELIILRLVGYDGNYTHRRHLQGVLTGDTEPVPWNP